MSAEATTPTSRRLFYSRLATLCMLIGVISGNHTFANEKEINQYNKSNRGIYAGAGLGFGWTNPDTTQFTEQGLDDQLDKGGQINLGFDLFKQLSLELHSTVLGSAGLSPTGRIDYRAEGISALLYASDNRGRLSRTGVTAYGRGGYGQLNTLTTDAAPLTNTRTKQWLWGAGLEYMNPNGFGARAEFISFSDEARYGQLGMIYRFGQRRANTVPENTPTTHTLKTKPTKRARLEIPPPPTPPALYPPPSPPPAFYPPPPPPPAFYPPPPAPSPLSATQRQAAPSTEEERCSELKGVIEGIRFDSGSAILSLPARVVLDNIAVTLAKCEKLPVIISAHTDNQGSERINQILSQRRAWAVINYLRGIGIGLYRLTPKAFGETQPIDSNTTAEGRSNNRRVELIAQYPVSDIPR